MIVADAPAWPAWRLVTPVLLNRDVSHAPVLVRVRLPPLGIAPGAAADYPDVRVIDEAGHEIPYALDPPQAPPSNVRDLPVIDTGFVPGRGSQAVVDLGDGASLVDSVTLDVDVAARPTYFERVAIDASDDRATWREVRTDAIVYRVAQDDGRGNQTIAVPATRSRWLRVRALDGRTPFPITGAVVANGHVPPEPALVPIPLEASYAYDAASHDQSWTFVGTRPFRASAVAFDGARGAFARTVRVETSDDGTAWSDAGEATISRFADGSTRTSFGCDERTSRRVRVTIANGNDAPLPDLHPVLLARPHAVVFMAAPGTSYALLSGNAEAGAPSYDLAERLGHERWQARAGFASATEPNGAYRDPRPLGERAPWILTAASTGLTIALALAAVATIRRARRPGDEPA